MAENISIETDGVSHNYNGVKAIYTKSADGDTTKWIPNLDTMLMTKRINKNGTYKAVNDDAYAYDKVIVSTSGKATGKKQDGNTYVVKPDANGDLQETKVPVRIEITTNPSKLNYTDEEAIDLTGAVVKAYNGDGSLWTASGYSGGVIPNSEINLRPTHADYRGEDDGIYEKDGVRAMAFRCSTPVSGYYWRNYRSASPNGYMQNGAGGRHYVFLTTNTDTEIIYVTKYDKGNGLRFFAASSLGNGSTSVIAYEDASGAYANESMGSTSTPYEFGAGPYDSGQFSNYDIPTSDVDPEGVNFRDAVGRSESQTITVAWNRPADEEELTDTFDITVSPLR